jgi:coenzyme PQQ precursor peptide PqqA
MLKETWSKPEVIEQQIGLEVTSYAPAEIEAA